MPKLVDRIADLIELRDRDELDVALIRLLWDLLGAGATAATILQPVGEENDPRWLTRIDYRPCEGSPHLGEAQALASLPRLSDFPHHQEALTSGHLRRVQSSTCHTLFPISAQHEGLGVLEIVSEIPLTAETEHLVASVLRVYHNFHGLLDYGERDTLTSLLNRKTFDGVFLKATLASGDAEVDPATERRQSPSGARSWLGVMDIDHFKRVNDTYGHLIGDEVLILMARLMKSSFRFQDQIYRFGGEEFAVLVQCDRESDAIAAFERFRRNAEEHVFPQVEHITISIGVTALRPGDTPSSAFERADKAVYHAKSHGRNQVCNHAVLVASGEVVEVDSAQAEAEFF